MVSLLTKSFAPILIAVLVLICTGCTTTPIAAPAGPTHSPPGVTTKASPTKRVEKTEPTTASTSLPRITATTIAVSNTSRTSEPTTTSVSQSGSSSAEKIPNPQPYPTLAAEEWKTLPVLPALSPRALAILRDGIERGNNPRVFSKIGDCESETEWFLDPFDKGPKYFDLGPYEEDMQPVLEYYQGSFSRKSLAARRGFTAASLLVPLWANREKCGDEEAPLACEIRLNRPIVAFIMLGTNDASNPPVFEHRLRQVIEYTLSQGVLPVLGTKADNLEGDHSINHIIASLAREYDIPLWNYWAALQGLPGNGLSEDGAHLTFTGPFYNNPDALRRGWPVRNLNALQILKMLMEHAVESK
jgi:hypothetical protein